MQTALTYRTNRDLFSNYYLDEHLPETEAWDELSDEELREKRSEIIDLWEREQDTVAERTESSLEEKFIRPLFRKLGIPFEVEETVQRGQRRPDYGFFPSEDAARDAFSRKKEGGDFYKDAVAVADAKRWGRPLDTRGSGEHERDFENPSYQIHVYLQETPARWAVLTDGKKWRLYYGPTSHRLDSYYEIDLPTVLEKGDLEDFKYFYLFFRHGAFLEGSSGECFLDEVYDESNVFAQELGEDLQDNIYEAIKVLSEGFMQYPDNDLSEDDLDLIHDSSLIYLYRLIFVLYAESEGRDLLDTNNEIYEESYSLNTLKQDVAEELDSPNPKYRDWQDNLWDRLDELFKLIDQGSQSRGIPEEDLYIPAYNGGLFRTNPDEDDSVEARFLANHQVGDAYLAEVIELLTRSQNGNGGGKIFVDYSSLDVRHLGSIYEGLLEYQLDVADEPLALEDGEYVPAGESDEVIVEKGEVHLSTGSGERKATGSYYTPEYVVEYIVEETLEPLVTDISEDLMAQSARDEGGFAAEFAERIFDLKILDPAMGSGHFLTSAIDYLAREIIDAQERQAAQQGIETVDEEHDINWARRQVAQRCIYGVDLNPLAVELAKVSLWLRTLAAEQPLAFLDHHLKTGNSLVGSDIEEIEELESDAGGDGQNATLADFGVARKGTIEQLMRIYQDFIAIENQELADVKEMEEKYDEFERNKLRQRLEAMTNVHTAEEFGLDELPSDAYQRMAAALEDDDKWGEIAEMQWFNDAQQWANQDNYFHWKLAFPEVFYSREGEKLADPGFDAVIGNPPYVRVQNLPHRIIDYIKQEFETAYRRVDISIAFFERATLLSKKSGELGYISSTQFRNSTYGEKLREFLGKRNVRKVVDFGDLDVFEGATTYAGIFIWNPQFRDSTSAQYYSVDQLSDGLMTKLYNPDGELVTQYETVLPPDQEWGFSNKEEREVIDQLESHRRLVDVGESVSGIISGRDSVFLLDPDEVRELEIEDEILLDVIRGKDPDRWHLKGASKQIIYPYREGDNATVLMDEDELAEDFPNAYSYLKEHENDLRSRKDSRTTLNDENWYQITRQGRLSKYKQRKIVTSGESKQNQFCIDKEGRGYSFARIYGVLADEIELDVLLAILNSDIIEFYLHKIAPLKRGEYYSYSCDYLDKVPIPEGNCEELNPLAKEAQEVKSEMEQQNLEIQDYVDLSSGDTTLLDLAGYQPAPGINETPLSKTKEELESLRVGDIRIDLDNHASVSLTARYKPEDDEIETDQWGYTETDPITAMKFVGFTDAEKVYLAESLKTIINEGGGFANFRETATTTMSLLDRLSNIQLPHPEEVSNQIQAFYSTYTRQEELSQRLEEVEKEINTILVDEYSLSNDQLELIKESK